jgi:DNA modification methylase
MMHLNKLYCDDNLEVMKRLPSNSIDLIYIDPPFFSNRNYESIWNDKQETASFNDRWKGGINHYCEWMRERLTEIHRLLKPTGSLFCHLDWHACHYIKLELDKIFGYQNFRNEIIWHYFMGGKPKKFFARKHDNIFWYAKSDKWTFNYQKHLRQLPKKPSLKSHKGIFEKEGIWYSEVGMDDVWDISGVFNMSNEYMGYPTQKPELLLERIIKSCSKEGNIIADFFCGCGTALAVAHKLGRKYIGCDISPTAIKIANERLKK